MTTDQPAPPPTRTVDVVDDYHGTVVADPYRWLEEPREDEVAEWIAAQNAATRAHLDPLPARDAFAARLAELWDFPKAGAPSKRGGRWFQSRNSGMQDQDVLYVMDAPDAEGEVLVDPNTLSEDGTTSLAGAAVSRDGSLLAWAASEAGSDWMTWRVRDIATKADRTDVVEWAKFSGAAWLPDGSAFAYGCFDPPGEGREYEDANRGHRLKLHRIGTDSADDEVLLDDPEHPERIFAPSVTDDGAFLIIHIAEGTDPRSRVWVCDLADGLGRPVPLLDDFDAAYAVIGSVGRTLFVLTDRDAPRSRLVAVDVDDPRPAAWREVIAEGADTLESATIVGGRLFAVHLHHARHRLSRFTLDGVPEGDVDLGEVASVSELAGRQEDPDLYLTTTSFTNPSTVLVHRVETRETEVVRPPGIAIDPSEFVTEQVFVPSTDGVDVPMFVVHRSDVDLAAGPHPTMLWGYGGFNIPVTPAFRLGWFAWVEAGGVLAVPNLRGGGEYGKEWHDGGRLDNKQQVFDDALACADWLVARGWTSRDRIGLNGGSNGGLLVGALMTQRPDGFGAAVPEVGVLDMLRFHHFTIGWAWASDYGCADDSPEELATLLAYSPLHNLKPGVAYPPTLIVTGDHDDRVVPAHSFKFAAALQAAHDGPAPTLLRVQVDAGHGLGKPTRVLIAERADVLAFLAHHLGLEVPAAAAAQRTGDLHDTGSEAAAAG